LWKAYFEYALGLDVTPSSVKSENGQCISESSADGVHQQLQVQEKCIDAKKELPAGVWEIELSAGDLLFIPSMYFHTLTTGPGSVSLSMWMASRSSFLLQKISKSVTIDFEPSASTSLKLASIATVVRAYCKKANEPISKFASFLEGRIAGSLRDSSASVQGQTEGKLELILESRVGVGAFSDCKTWEGIGYFPSKGTCNILHNNFAESQSSHHRSSIMLHALLTKVPLNSVLSPLHADIKNMILAEWVEEFIGTIFKDGSFSPCDYQDFISTCILRVGI
jgi:hypothetical protein